MACSKYNSYDLPLGYQKSVLEYFGSKLFTLIFGLLNCLKFFDFIMSKPKTAKPWTYPEKSIGLGNLDVKYSKYFDRIDVVLVLTMCRPHLKWCKYGKKVPCAMNHTCIVQT